MNRFFKLLPLLAGLFLSTAASDLPPAIDILRADARLDYPLEITFSIEAESDSELRTVELEYGLTGRDCSPDINLAVPEDFSPAKGVDLEWTWRVAASGGNLPPGAKIWGNWHLVNAEGNDASE